jgi:hypothetical protein
MPLKMPLPEGFRLFAESPNYILGHVYEYGSIIDKRSGEDIYIGDSYGDPTCGRIDTNENWALLFGHDSYLWTPASIKHLNHHFPATGELFKWPFDARQINEFEVEILDDPWSSNPGIYSFNIKTDTIKRIKDFKKPDIPYKEFDRTMFKW